MAVARLRGFRSHLHGPITLSVVVEYNSIIKSLEEASDEDLRAFSISPSSMIPRVMREREIVRHKFDTGPRFSTETYCNSGEFREKSDGLWRFAHNFASPTEV